MFKVILNPFEILKQVQDDVKFSPITSQLQYNMKLCGILV